MAGARWVRLDVDYHDNPKVLAAGREGRDLHLASICWVGRYLTDGVIPESAVPIIARSVGVKVSVAGRLVDAGLWVPNGYPGGFELHDYIEMGNPTRESVERERARWRDVKRKQREQNG
jgi:hypothetical protein